MCYNDEDGMSFASIVGTIAKSIAKVANEIVNAVIRINKMVSGVKKINSVAKPYNQITKEQIVKSIISPIPKQLMSEIECDLSNWLGDETILFSYYNGPNNSIVYSEDKYGSINMRVYYYHTASIASGGLECIPIMDMFFMFADDPGSSSLFPEWYSVLASIYSWARNQEITSLKSDFYRIYRSDNDPHKATMYYWI